MVSQTGVIFESPGTIQPGHSERGVGGQKSNQTLTKVIIKRKFPPKQKQRDLPLK